MYSIKVYLYYINLLTVLKNIFYLLELENEL